jgi:hypothetical protein
MNYEGKVKKTVTLDNCGLNPKWTDTFAFEVPSARREDAIYIKMVDENTINDE